MQSSDDVIAAIATAVGVGGIGIVRLSGKGAIEIADRGFRGRRPLTQAASHTVHHGWFVGPDGFKIDEVLATVFRNPHSYTAEDMVEISCHGGSLVVRSVLSAVIVMGARLAEAGEFTRRAFLNGRLDLTQAEAVAELVYARSEAGLRCSLRQLEGVLSARLNAIMERLVDICSSIEADLDFVEENLEACKPEAIAAQLRVVTEDLESLLGSYKRGLRYKDGIRVVIAGPPNVGKSSLLNALVERDRAIVTNTPGTTRDVIEESVMLGGVLFRLLDTAGLRDVSDEVESEGVRRTWREIEGADCCLFLMDATLPRDPQVVRTFLGLSEQYARDGKEVVLLENKCDLLGVGKGDWVVPDAKRNSPRTLRISARTGQGLDRLIQELVILCGSSLSQDLESGVLITSARHQESVRRANDSLRRCLENVQVGAGNELLAIDLREALDHLGAVVGKVTSEDLLDRIFSRFCIGK